MKIDLHMHSTASDGVLTPLQLVEKAASLGVEAMAITDHVTMAGAESLRDKALPVKLIPGVELNLNDMRSLHLLGYGLRRNTALHCKVAQLAENRIARARAMAALMEKEGVPVDIERILADHSGSVGRPHLAREMVKLGYVKDAQEAFVRYLKEGRPCYVDGDRLSMREALQLMLDSGFVPVLAHPYQLDVEELHLPALLRAWQQQGLMGVEVYHPSAARKGYAGLDSMARRMGLLVTGGSDFHQEGDVKHGMPGCTSGDWRQAERDLAALESALHT